MSHGGGVDGHADGRFPRVSGDEPRAAAAGWFMTAFSPRERG